MRNRINFSIIIFALITTAFSSAAFSQISLNTPNVESLLYLSEGNNQPLIVGFGGSEGGNAWASDRWKTIRDEFIKRGYAFLAIGYFGAENTPKILNRISIDKIHDAIIAAAKNPKINKKKIAIVGGSRGGDLALLVASYYRDIKCVVAIVPSHAAFPGHTTDFLTSAWEFKGKQLPFVPVSDEAVPFLIKRDLRKTFEIMLKDAKAEEKALIKVEKIDGPIFLISATEDEIAPTTPMCEKMEKRLTAKKFRNHFEHLAVRGLHTEPQKHFEKVFSFLEINFRQK